MAPPPTHTILSKPQATNSKKQENLATRCHMYLLCDHGSWVVVPTCRAPPNNHTTYQRGTHCKSHTKTLNWRKHGATPPLPTCQNHEPQTPWLNKPWPIDITIYVFTFLWWIIRWWFPHTVRHHFQKLHYSQIPMWDGCHKILGTKGLLWGTEVHVDKLVYFILWF